ncbi:MAG: hypothetical protein AAGI22_22480, partial [Planctomycetota bacterium]
WVSGGADTRWGCRGAVPRPHTGGLVAAFVPPGPPRGGVDSTGARDAAVATLDGRDEYRSHELQDDVEIDGRGAAGVDITWETEASGTFCIRQRYLVADGRTFLLQAHAPVDRWEQHADEIQAFFTSFAVIEPTADELAVASVGDLAARCGSEVELASSWEDASRRARESGRHVLVVMRSYPGFDIPDTTQLVTFMSEEVVALVRSRLIAVRLSKDSPSPLRDPAVYGLSRSTFGVAFLLVDADGNVLADTPHTEPEVLLRWLSLELARHPDSSIDERPTDPVEAAELALDRGELDLAEQSLEGLDVLGAHRARARLLRRRGDIAGALATLDAALAAADEPAHDLLCDRAEILFREGRDDEARRALQPVLDDVTSPAHPEALFLSSYLEQRESGADAARMQLMQSFPDSRWAWLAAAYVKLEPLMQMAGSDMEIRWPRADVLALMTDEVAEPLEPDELGRAARDAVAWLVEHQRADGSWPGPTELRRPDDEPPDLIMTAVDALATRAVLQRGWMYRDVAERGLAFLLASDARRREDPPPVVYMDYTAWAAWAQLELAVDALEAELGDPSELRAFAGRLVSDLESRVRSNGGWSYYISSDAAGANPVEQSISFTTAAAVVSLVRARQAGIDVPDRLVDGALDCLEEMRGDDGLFAYMLQYPSGGQTRNAAPGAAGRGPACELALSAGGRGGDERLRGSLELFTENSGALAAEVGKALMHAGADTQGCHYPFFDYLMAARAAERLGARDVAALRARMVDLVLAARHSDGSFQDTPILGQTYGTAAALLTLEALRDQSLGRNR